MLTNFCLEEYLNIGYMEGISDVFNSIRGFNMSVQVLSLIHIYLSALELGNVSRTANNEEVLGCAIDEIIRSRKSSLFGLEQMIRQLSLIHI